MLWLLERPAAPVAGAVISAIGLHSALREQAVKVRVARVLGRAVPSARMKSGIDPETLSRDPEVVAAYRKDKLVHDIVSLGFGRDALDGVDAVLAGASRLAVPLLVIHGSEDALAYASGARELAALAPGVCTLQVYDGLFHEIHHEPEQAQVFADVLAWIDRSPRSCASALPSRTAAPAAVAQLVEHVTRNDGVSGSNPLGGSGACPP